MIDDLEFTTTSIIFFLVAISLYSVVFLSQIFFKKQILTLQNDRRFKSFFVSDFYKVPFRYGGLLWIFLLSFFRQSEKIYLKHALEGKYSYINIEKELLLTLGKETYYSYCLFIFNTITFFQKVRLEKQNRKEENFIYPGFLGYLGMFRDAYNYPQKDKINKINHARFDLDTWIPKDLVQKYIQMEPNRLLKYYYHKEEKSELDLSQWLNKDLSELAIETRSIGKKSKKSF